MIKSKPYDVVLLPADYISEQAIKLSKMISQNFATYFTLDGRTKYPHATLYQIEIYDKNLESFKKHLSKIFSGQKEISTDLLEFSNHDTFLFWDVQKTKAFYKLHQSVVEKLNALRDGLKVSVVLSAFDDFSDSQKNELEQYGAIGIAENFHPHITITRLKNSSDVKSALALLNQHEKEVIFNKAALGLLSDHGTVIDIIEEFYLK